jgi:hypothetical protein
MGEPWFAWDIGLQKLAVWLQTKHVDRHVKPLFDKQNGPILTGKSTTATITTGLQTCLKCKPHIIRGSITCQKEDMLRVKENKSQNQKKSHVVRHAM